MILTTFDDDLWGIIGKRAYSLNEQKNIIYNKKINTNELVILNGNDNIKYDKNFVSLRSPSGYVLNFDIKYIQPSGKSRFYSYALSNILYNLGYNWHTPETISSYFNYEDGVSFKELSSYLNNYNFSNDAKDSGYLFKGEVIEQIYYKNSYILIGGTNTFSKGQHALVIFGYNNTNNTYSFWNPWYNFTQYMDMDSKLINTKSSTVYKWNAGYIKNIGKIK